MFFHAYRHCSGSLAGADHLDAFRLDPGQVRRHHRCGLHGGDGGLEPTDQQITRGCVLHAGGAP
jgi:hypothetical protein